MKLKRLLLASALALSFVVSTPTQAKADPISAAIVTFIGFTGTAATVATFVINSALYAVGSWAVGKAAQALGLVKSAVAERQASVTTLSLGETPRELIVGQACTGGTLIDAFNFGGKYGTDTVTRCIGLADHELAAIVGYYVDDKYYPWVVSGVQPGFNGKLSIDFRNAADVGWAPPLHVIQNGGWAFTDRLCSIAHVWIDTRVDDQVWSQGHPRFRFVINGLKAFDPRKDAALGYTGPNPHVWEDVSTHEFTRNAEVLRYNFQRGIFATGKHGQAEHLLLGRGLTAEEAPPHRVIAAANLCDEIVDGQPRYTANGVISAAQSFIDVEEMFAAAMAGVIVQRDGGVEVEPGQAKAAFPTITDADLAAGEPVSFTEFQPDTDGGRINTVVPRYVEPAQGYKDHGGPPRRDLADIQEDGGPREMTLPLMLVTSGGQADRCAEIARRRARLERRASIVLPPDYAEIEEGDWIAWKSDRYHDGGTVRYQVTSYSLDEKWRQHISLEEIASSVYGVPDPIDDRGDPPPPPSPIDALVLNGVTAEAITLAGETSTLPAIRFRWDVAVSDTAMTAVRAEVRRAGETEIATTRSEDVDAGALIVTNGVWPDAALEARLVPIGDPSRPVLASAWFSLSTSTIVAGDTTHVGGVPVGDLPGLDTTPPADVAGLALSSTSTPDAAGNPYVRIIATWTANTDEDLNGYEVEITEGGVTVVDYVATNQHSREALTGRTYTFRVRAIDKAGNRSAWTAPQDIVGAGDTTPPGPPTTLEATASVGSIFLRWTNPGASDLAKVEVWENTTNNSGTATKIAAVVGQPSGAGSYSRSGLPSGVTRYYWLKAVDTSGNASGFSSGISATTASIQVTDFASNISAPELMTTVQRLAATPTLGRIVFDTTDGKLYRGTGSVWDRSTDGADITADSITAGQIAAGAISTTELAAGAVTAGKIGAGQVTTTELAAGAVNADKIQAGSITGDRISTSTSLPGTITVGSTGVSIGTIQSQANDPAARVNANSTLITPGRIQIQGGTSLDNWRDGTDINGGSIKTNSIQARSLVLAMRNVQSINNTFRAYPDTNVAGWTGGGIVYQNDSGTTTGVGLSGGSVSYTGATVFIYWSLGSGFLSTTTSEAVANGPNNVIMATYNGGALLTVYNGRTLITPEGIVTPSLSAISGNIGSVTAGILRSPTDSYVLNLDAAAERMLFAGGIAYRGELIGLSSEGIYLWVGPSSIARADARKSNAWLGLSMNTTGGPRFFGTDAPSGSGFHAQANATVRVGSRTSAGPVTTSSVTITTTGATGSVSHAWSQLSGDDTWSITSSSGAITAFSTSVSTPGEQKRATFADLVTDAGSGRSYTIIVGAAALYNV